VNRLLSINPGLSSRFPEEIAFQNTTPGECLTLLQSQLKKAGIEFVLEDRPSGSYSDMVDMFNKFFSLPGGNGRDIQTLSKSIIGTAFASTESAATKLTVSNKDVFAALEKMYNEQKARSGTKTKPTIAEMIRNATMPQLFDPPTNLFSATATATTKSSATKTAEPTPALKEHNPRQEQRPDVAPQGTK
jgi:hypothetical protein